MIIDQTAIVGVSDLNPIQFWGTDNETFNQRDIPLLLKQYYYQRWNYDESLYIRLDIEFNSARYEPWNNTNSYSIGEVAYDDVNLTRWRSLIDGNVGNALVVGANWARDPFANNLTPTYAGGTTYNAGDRVYRTSKVYQSLIDGNIGNAPESSPADWEQVTEADGFYQLLFVVGSTTVAFVDFENIRAGSTHQAVSFLWNSFPDLQNQMIQVLVWDVQNQVILGKSDCMNIQSLSDSDPTLLIQYTNSRDWMGILFEGVNAQFFIRLDAHFYRRSKVISSEDQNLSNGRIVSLRKETVEKRLLKIIEALPDYMHIKNVSILTCDNIMIDDLPWRLGQSDTYQNPDIDTSQLSFAEALLTESDSVLVNLSKNDGGSGGRVFNGEFSNPFA